MIICKPNVRFKRLLPQIYSLFAKLDAMFTTYGLDCVITSGNDSTHKTGSLHYADLAVDLRSKHVPEEDKDAALEQLRAICGPDYDVLLEHRGGEQEHFHVEYDKDA